MDTFVVRADSKTSKALITIFKAFNVSFEVHKDKKQKEESPYDPEFIKMVLEGNKNNERILFTVEYKKELFQDL
jgi:hypothetical protein